MNYLIYLLIRIINFPSLPIAILIGMFWGGFYVLYLIKRKNVEPMQAILITQGKAMETMKSTYLQVNIKGIQPLLISHLGIIFWIVFIWFLL